MAGSTEFWAGLGSALAFLVGLVAAAMNHVKIKLWMNKIAAYFSPYIQITIPEYGDDPFQITIRQYGDDPSQATEREFFLAVEADLSQYCAHGARKLRANLGRDSKKFQASLDDDQEIIDTFDQGSARFWWYAYTEHPRSQVLIYSPADEKRRFYRLVFHKKFRKSVLESYLPLVLEKGRAIIADNRKHRLFTNISSTRVQARTFWRPVEFQHPATFATLAMDPAEKEAIIDDLNAFRQGKEYYTMIGKAWKRGYLLFGPPGTGKSTMIAATANHLQYDVYDLELTVVKNNTELRTLFALTTGKSIIVIEDIDRTVDITVNCRDNKLPKKKKSGGGESSNLTSLLLEEEKDDEETKLTLSGLLNFIDGLWSACGGERIIIFTTNNRDKLDPALIRPGRMDKHIEMSYCRREAFKQLASNYLGVDTNMLNENQFFNQFGQIPPLLDEVDMSPADVAEHLMRTEMRDATACLNGLLLALTKAKDDAAKDKTKANEYAVEIVHGETLAEAVQPK